MRQPPVSHSSSLPTPVSTSITPESQASHGRAEAQASHGRAESQAIFAVHGRWIPGTHQVRLERQDTPSSLEVHHRVHQLFGRGAMDPLYLTGKSRFDCTSAEWISLEG
jgi:hypothetical protein